MSPHCFRFSRRLHFPWGSLSKPRPAEIDMSVGALLPKLILFSIPLALSNVLQIAFNMADLIVAGRYVGDRALAAVGSNASLVSLLVCLIGGLTLGVGVLVSRFYGAKDDAALRETVRTSFATIAIGSAIFGALGAVFSVPILRMMETPDEVIPLAALYLRIYFAGFPALALYNCAAAILRAVGDARRPLYYLTIAGVLNVVLNFVFVVFFGWGVAGVAVATVVASTVSCVLTLRLLARSTAAYRFDYRDLRIDRKRLGALLYIGIPAGIQGSLFSFSNVVVQGAINSLGETAMAGAAASLQIESIVYVAQNALSSAAATSASQNVGAGSYSRVKRAVALCVMLNVVACLVLGGGAFLFRRELLCVFTPDEAAIRAGEIRIVILLSTYFLCGGMDVCGNALRGLGYSLFPTLAIFLGVCVLRVLWILFVFPTRPSLETIFLSYPLSWGLACVVLFAGYFLGRRRGFERLTGLKSTPSARNAAE